jgi:hypothetical protein
MHSLPEHLRRLRKMLYSPQACQAAWAILEDYFNCFYPDDIRDELQFITALLKGEAPASEFTPKKKEEAIFFICYTRLASEAMYVLNVHFQYYHLPMRLWQKMDMN